ncbi:MAG: hypothetical protein ABSC06_40030 [Rhodopila sp.]|jgi:hypothetical protein
MAGMTPVPRIGKFAGPTRKPAGKARKLLKPRKPKPKLAFAPGLINR